MTKVAPKTGTESILIDDLLIKKGALIIRAINHQLRQQILQLIHQKGEITVTEIYTKLRLEQSVASQHLQILRTTGFVSARRDSKLIYYSVNYKRFEQVQRILKEMVHQG